MNGQFESPARPSTRIKPVIDRWIDSAERKSERAIDEFSRLDRLRRRLRRRSLFSCFAAAAAENEDDDDYEAVFTFSAGGER